MTEHTFSPDDGDDERFDIEETIKTLSDKHGLPEPYVNRDIGRGYTVTYPTGDENPSFYISDAVLATAPNKTDRVEFMIERVGQRIGPDGQTELTDMIDLVGDPEK